MGAAALALGCQPLGFPSFGGDSHDDGTKDHEHRVDQAHGQHRLASTCAARLGKMLHQLDCQRATDECTTAEAHDGHACGHAGSVGEPLHQCGDWSDVAQPQTHAAEESVAAQHQPEQL